MTGYRCVQGHDKCAEMYPCKECPYCERIVSSYRGNYRMGNEATRNQEIRQALENILESSDLSPATLAAAIAAGKTILARIKGHEAAVRDRREERMKSKTRSLTPAVPGEG